MSFMKVWLENFKLVNASPKEKGNNFVQNLKFWYLEQSMTCFHKNGASRNPKVFLRSHRLKSFDQGLQLLQNMIRMEIVEFASCIKKLVVWKFWKVLSKLFNLYSPIIELLLFLLFDFFQIFFSWNSNSFRKKYPTIQSFFILASNIWLS